MLSLTRPTIRPLIPIILPWMSLILRPRLLKSVMERSITVHYCRISGVGQEIKQNIPEMKEKPINMEVIDVPTIKLRESSLEVKNPNLSPEILEIKEKEKVQPIPVIRKSHLKPRPKIKNLDPKTLLIFSINSRLETSGNPPPDATTLFSPNFGE